MTADEEHTRATVEQWLSDEWGLYQSKKYDGALRQQDDAKLVEEGVGPGSYWFDEIGRYLHRAEVLGGAETSLGQQAIFKAAATALGLCESVLRAYGRPPAPGVPSGEVREWEVIE